MRTIKFLVLTLGLSAATPALAQSGLQPGAFPRVDRFARIEARRVARHQLQRQKAVNRLRHARIVLRGAPPALRAQVRAYNRPGYRAGFRRGLHAGLLVDPRGTPRASLRQGAGANATPEMRAFREQLSAQRHSIRAQVLEGKLTREQAHTQLRSWITEHRPTK